MKRYSRKKSAIKKIGCGCTQAGGANNSTKKNNNNNSSQTNTNTKTNTNNITNLAVNTSLSNTNKKNSENSENKENAHSASTNSKTVNNTSNKKNETENITNKNINAMTDEELDTLLAKNPELFKDLEKDLANPTYKNTSILENNNDMPTNQMKNSSKKISTILNTIAQQARERTDGYYIIGVNIMNVLDELFKSTTLANEKQNNQVLNYKSKFKKIGEFVNVNPDEVEFMKPLMSRQSSNIVNNITNNMSLLNIAKKSSKFDNVGNITPEGLLNMTRMMFDIKKSEKQWLRIAKLLEVIYDNVGRIQDLTRKDFFSQKTPLEIDLIKELEEIYTTQDIFKPSVELDSDAYNFYSMADIE